MSAASRLVVLLTLSLVAVCGGPGKADPVASAALESTQFVHTLTGEIAKSLAAQAEDLNRQRAPLVQRRDAATGAERQELTGQIQELDARIMELTSQQTLAEGNKTAWAIHSGLSTIYTTLGEMEQRLGQLDTWSPGIVDLDLMAADQLASLRESIQSATSAATLIGQMEELRRAVRQVDAVASTPQSKKMMVSLSIVLQSMQWIAKLTPTIEPFIAQYGDAGQAMLAASARIQARILESQKGLFVQGRPDDGRLQAFDTQLPDLAEERDMLNIMPLPGVRDAYLFPRGNDPIVLIWDPAGLRWHRTDLPAREVMRRYAFFASFGNPNPSPDQVLGRLSDRVVGLTMTVEHSIVPPGGKTRVGVYAERLDGTRVSYLGIKLSVREEMLLVGAGDPGRIEPPIVDAAPEDMAVWRAPDKEHSVFTITAALTDDEDVYQVVQPATCSVATGGLAVIRARAEPQEVEPGGDGTISYEVVDARGNLLAPKVPVTLFGEPGLEVEAGEWLSQTEARGSATYHAPRRPGVYGVRLFFPGYMDAGYIYGRNYMSSQAAVTVTVPGVPEPEPIIVRADPEPEPDNEPQNTQVVTQPDTPAPQPQPQNLNLIPGTYDGSFYDDGGYTTVVVLSGDPDGGVNWQLSRSYHGQHQYTRTGAVTPTGEIRDGNKILGGYYQEEGRGNLSWAEIPVRQDADGNWVPVYLRYWGGGRPETPHRGNIIYLKKRD